MSNPKPCPFCGHAGEAAVNSDAVRCRWHVGWQPRVDWNARPIEDRLQLQLDAIRGLATGQPGSDPSSSDQGWSPALCAVRAVLRERDEALRRVDIAHEGTGNAWAETERITAERDRLREALRALLSVFPEPENHEESEAIYIARDALEEKP